MMLHGPGNDCIMHHGLHGTGVGPSRLVWTGIRKRPSTKKRVCCNSCDFFFLAVNARNKKTASAYTTYSKKKKLHDLTVFLLHAFAAKKKNYTTYSRKKKITRPDGFLLHAFTAEKKGGLAHLWATSDSAPRSEAVGLPDTAGVR